MPGTYRSSFLFGAGLAGCSEDTAPTQSTASLAPSANPPPASPVLPKRVEGITTVVSQSAAIEPTPSAADEPTTVASIAAQSDLAKLAGDWQLENLIKLPDGHRLTMNNKYRFHLDGTFTNTSRTKLSHRDTGDAIYTLTTKESGTWTLDENNTCWTTKTAEILEFESFSSRITRKVVEEGLAEDDPPDRFKIVSMQESWVKLQPEDGGGVVTLTRVP